MRETLVNFRSMGVPFLNLKKNDDVSAISTPVSVSKLNSWVLFASKMEANTIRKASIFQEKFGGKVRAAGSKQMNK